MFKAIKKLLGYEKRALTYEDIVLRNALGVRPTNSGVSVSEETAIALPAIWAAVNVISQAIGSLDLYSYRKLSNGGRLEATEHPVYDLLLVEPNPELTAVIFKEIVQAHALLYGTAYVEIQRDGAGRPVALWPIHPTYVTADRDEQGQLFKVRIPGKQEAILRHEDVLVIPGLSAGDGIGYRLVQLCRDAIGMAMATEKFGQDWFSKGCKAAYMVEVPTNIGETAQANTIEGLEEASHIAEWKTFLPVPGGVKATALSSPANDVNQFDETRRTNMILVSQLFSLPPHKLRLDTNNRPGGNIEAEQLSFIHETLRRWIKVWQAECNRKLFSKDERKTLFVEFDLSDFLSQYTIDCLNSMIEGGWFLKSEAREWFGLDPVAGIDNPPEPKQLPEGNKPDDKESDG